MFRIKQDRPSESQAESAWTDFDWDWIVQAS